MGEELAAYDELSREAERRREARCGSGSLRIGRERSIFEVVGLHVRDGMFFLAMEQGWQIEGTVNGNPSASQFQLVTGFPNSGQYTFLDDLPPTGSASGTPRDERCFNFAENTRIEVSRSDDRLEMRYTGRAFVTRPGSDTPQAEPVDCEFRADCGSNLTDD
jgi:hypothetical protein